MQEETTRFTSLIFVHLCKTVYTNVFISFWLEGLVFIPHTSGECFNPKWLLIDFARCYLIDSLFDVIILLLSKFTKKNLSSSNSVTRTVLK